MNIKIIISRFTICIALLSISIGCKNTSSKETIAILSHTTPANELQKEQMHMVAAFSGATEISQGQTIKGRFEEEEKSFVRSYINEQLREIKLSPQDHAYEITITYDDGSTKDFEGTNVYTTIPSTIPSDEYILIGAHYDAVPYSPGANDNATGCALVYGISKQISSLKTRNKNVIVAFFDQEEFGLVGSKAFARFIKKEKYTIHSVHTVDQMGWDKDNDKAIELELPTPYLNSIYKKHANKMNLSVFKTDVASTDHSSFRSAGYKAIGLTEEYKNGDTTPHYHQNSDTYDTIDFEYLSSSTELMYQVIKELVTD
ncbi:M28 family peptidase [Dokdonia sp.]|uniref:M28 family metallopeptidase n=1 Tax=Dokdonia sp. TaxID=2024995 RepID=UPI003267B741